MDDGEQQRDRCPPQEEPDCRPGLQAVIQRCKQQCKAETDLEIDETADQRGAPGEIQHADLPIVAAAEQAPMQHDGA